MRVGDQVGGYRLERYVGADASGDLWEARDEALERAVLLRFPPEEFSSDSKSVERFRRCCRSLARLDHPHIAKVHELGEHEGRPYVAAAHDWAGTLPELLAGGPLSEAAVARLGIQSLGALEAASGGGVVHGAITPASFALGDGGEAQLVDFGFCNALSAGAPLSEVAELAHASPERAAGAAPTKASDVWSLVAVLRHALTGKPPFSGDYPAAVSYAVQNDPPEPLPESIGYSLRRALDDGFEKNPESRLSDAQELCRRLEAVRDEQETTKSIPLPTAPRRRVRRKQSRRAWIYGAAAAATAGAAGAWWGWSRSGSVPTGQLGGRSLAVLPLRNLSANPDEDFFADGMTDELITSLAQIEALRVISRTSVMQYKSREASIPEIADRLRVQYVLDGSVQRQGDQVRIQATLIEASSDRNVWANSYDQNLTDVFQLQSEVARAIADEIQLELTPDEQQRLAAAQPVKAGSYEVYLRGLYLLNRRTPDAIARARELFEDVVRADPAFALAHAGLADALTLQASRAVDAPDRLWPAARRAVDRALELDPELAAAYSTRGVIQSFYEWDWLGAERSYEQALRLGPGDAVARQRYGIYLSRVGRHQAAVDALDRAFEADPLSVPIAHSAGVVRFMARRYDEAVELFRRNEETSPTGYRSPWYIGRCLVESGRAAEALAPLQLAVERSGGLDFLRASLAYGQARAGDLASAQALLREFQSAAGPSYQSPAVRLIVQLGLGDSEAALDVLDEAVERRDSLLAWLLVDPVFDPLRDEARFQAVLERTGLAQASNASA